MSSSSSSDEGEHLSIRSSNSGSGTSSSSVRTTQSSSESHSTSSRSSVSVHSADFISDQRSISSQGLQRANSQDSSSSRSRSSSPSIQSTSSKSEESSQEGSEQSEGSELESEQIKEQRVQEEQECSPKSERRLKDECLVIDASAFRDRTFDSGMVSSTGILQGGRSFRDSKRSPYSERGRKSLSPVTFIISKSLASNLGDVLCKTSGLATLLGRVITMPVTGTVRGVDSFGTFLKSSQKEIEEGGLKIFYKKEWTPMVCCIKEVCEALENDKEAVNEFLQELCDALDESFKTIDDDNALIVKAVEAIEKRLHKIEKKSKNKVVFSNDNGSQLQSDVVKLSSHISKLEEELMDLIDSKIMNIKEDYESKIKKLEKKITKSVDVSDKIRSIEDRLIEHEEEIGKVAERCRNAKRNSEEFKDNYKEKLLQPIQTGLGNILRQDNFEVYPDMENLQPLRVGLQERDTVMHNVPIDTHSEYIDLKGGVKLKHKTDIEFPSKSLPPIASFDWKTTDISGFVMKVLNFPEVMIMNNEYLKREFSQFQYFHCEAIRIIISSTSVFTQGGHLGVTWDPLTISTSCGVTDSYSLSNQYNFEIPAGDSCVRELIIPFVALQNLLCLAGKRRSSYSFGSLLFHPLNALKVPADTSEIVPILVYAQFIKPTYKVQTLIHDMYSKDKGKGSTAAESSAVSAGPKLVAVTPLDPKKYDSKGVPYSEQNPYRKFKDWYSSMDRSEEAEAFKTATKEKKLIEKGDGYIQIFPNVEGVFGGITSNLKIKEFVNENLIHMGVWKSSDRGKLLSLNCTPSELVRKGKNEFILPSMAQIAGLFKHWKGSFVYRFVFGANTLSRGKLRFVAVPEQGILSEPTYEDLKYLAGDIYDLNSTQRSLEVIVPFNHTLNYQYTNIEYFGDACFHGELVLSRLHVFVETPLLTNIGSNDEIEYFVTMKPGDDFEFSTPIGINMGHPIISKPQNDTIKEEGEGIENAPVEIARSAHNQGVIVGSDIIGFNLEKGYIMETYLEDEQTIILNVGPSSQTNNLASSPTSWLSSTHVRWSGGIEYEFLATGHNANIAKTILIYYIPYGYEIADDIIIKPGYLPASGFKFVEWDLSRDNKSTIRVNWSTPLQSLLVANEKLGSKCPDNLMYNGRLAMSLIGNIHESVKILGFMKASQDFKLYDRSYLKTIGSGTTAVFPLTQFKIMRSITELPVDKTNAVSIMPWPIENRYDATKKLAPTSADEKEMTPEKYKDLEDKFKKELAAAKKTKINAKANMEVHPNMMGVLAPMLFGKESADALKSLDIVNTVKGVNNLVDSGNLKRMSDVANQIKVGDIEKIMSFIKGVSPILEQGTKELPDILRNSSESLEKANEGFDIFTKIGRTILDWATKMVDYSFPGWIKSLHEHGEFAFAFIATVLAIVLFIWLYRRTRGESCATKIITLIVFMWSPLLGKGIFEFGLWLFTTFKEALMGAINYLADKFDWFQPKEEEVASKESIALQYVVSDMEINGMIKCLCDNPSMILTPIFMIGGSLIALKTLGRPSKGEENKSFVQKCGLLAKQLTGVTSLAVVISKLQNFGTEFVKIVTEWCYKLGGKELPEDAATQLGVSFKISEWVQKVSDYSREEVIHNKVAENEGLAEIRVLYEQGKKIMDGLIRHSKALPPNFAMVLRPLIETTKKMVDIAHKCKGSESFRRDPFMTVFYSGPGVGKSVAIEHMVIEGGNLFKYPKEHRRYTRNAGDKHWNTYNRQPMVVYDDLGAIKTQDGTDCGEIINLKSNAPFPVRMADLEEKGKMFSSDFIFASTNMKILPSTTDVQTHGAFYRRRNMFVVVEREEGIPKDPNDAMAGLLFQIEVLDRTNPADSNKGRTNPFGPKMNFKDFLCVWYTKAKSYMDKQDILVKRINEKLYEEGVALDDYTIAMRVKSILKDATIVSGAEDYEELMGEVDNISPNMEMYVEDLSNLEEEYNFRGFSGKKLCNTLDTEANYYEENLESVSSHDLYDHLRCICCCDVTKLYRNEECCANDCVSRVVKEMQARKDKFKYKHHINKFESNVPLKNMGQFELIFAILYMHRMQTPNVVGNCVIKSILEKQIKPQEIEKCKDYCRVVEEFPIAESLIQMDGFKVLLWDGIVEMFPALMVECGGVWFIDHQEIYLVTNKIQSSYPENKADLIYRCMKTMIKHGSILGKRFLLQHVPDEDMIIFRDAIRTLGSMNEKFKVSKSQQELLDQIKTMYQTTPIWILFMLTLYEQSHESYSELSRRKQRARLREAIQIQVERYKIEEETWYDKCSQGTKIALACGAGILAFASLLGIGTIIWKSISCLFPGSSTEIEEVRKEDKLIEENFTVEPEVIDLTPQNGAPNSSGDFKTKYQKTKKRVQVRQKKTVAVRNGEISSEDIHMEVAEKINAIAQYVGASKQHLEATGLMQLGKEAMNEIFKELDDDIVIKVLLTYPNAKNIIPAIKKLYESNQTPNDVYVSPKGTVVVPKNVTQLVQILGFDESNKIVKGYQPKYFDTEKIRADLCELTESGYKGPLTHKAMVHANLRDIRSEQLTRVTLRDANAQIFFPESKKRAQVIRPFGHIIVFPIHYLEDFKEGEIFHIAMMNAVHQLTFESSRLIAFTAGQDLIAYDCGVKVPAAKDIRCHFVTIKDIMEFKPCEGYLANTCCGVKGTTQYIDYTKQMNLITHENYPSGIYYDIGKHGTHNLTWALQYPIHSANGFCGSFIARIAPQCARKVMGIHVAANGNFNYGYAEIITQESLDVIYDAVTKKDGKPIEGLADVSVVVLPSIETEMEGYIKIEENNKGNMVFPIDLKSVTYVGDLDPKEVPYETNTTQIEPSIFHGIFGEVKTEPSILHERDHRLKENEFHGDLRMLWNPAVDGVSKYGEKVKQFSKQDIELIEDHLKEKFGQTENIFERRQVLTEDEMINGIIGPNYWDPIDMSTAPGYPYALYRQRGVKGKKYLFTESVVNNIPKYAISDHRLRTRLDEREKEAKEGKTFPTLALEKVKDERRKLEKIYKRPATRTFSCLPVDLNLLYRKYFLDFAVMQMDNRDQFACKVGINPDSLEWTKLYHQLNKLGGWAFAGDYGKFDGIGMPDIYMSITNVINSWYNDGNDTIRRVLVHELFHRYSLCGKSVFRIDQGMPSGFSMTVIFNSLMNYYFLAIAWLHLCKDKEFELEKDVKAMPLEAFDNLTEIATYGDDNVVAIHEDIKDTYNLKTVSAFFAQHGITYTDDLKRPIEQSEPYVKVSEVTFLKRGFLPMDKGKFIMRAPLNKVSITEQIQWVRASSDPKAALLANCENALYEASIYGKEYYTKLLDQLNTLVKLQKWHHPFESYEKQATRWWTNITMCDDYSHLHQLINEGKIVSGAPLSNLSSIKNFVGFVEECAYSGIPPVAFELDLGFEDLS